VSNGQVHARRVDLFASLISSALVLLVGATFLIISTVSLIKGSASRNWGAVMGTISHIERQANNHVTGVRYSYRFGNKTFKGDRICFGFSKARATSILLGKRAGERVLIYVDPQSPTQSTLITGPDPGMKIMCGLSVAATLTGAAVFWVTVRKLRSIS
jgi:hypothetical protein